MNDAAQHVGWVPCLPCSFTLVLMQRQSGLACLPSDRGPVITNVERTGKEILFVLIIAKEQVLSYCTSKLLVGFFEL